MLLDFLDSHNVAEGQCALLGGTDIKWLVIETDCDTD